MQILYELNEQVYMYDSEYSHVTICPKLFFKNNSTFLLELCNSDETNDRPLDEHLDGEL